MEYRVVFDNLLENAETSDLLLSGRTWQAEDKMPGHA